ncbi:hypothetical protein BC830DRAFT_959515 [Chytriomyces sp. MP71]|nr:hypothetical protein BC830DRAFT_959515 [Chytriomyces sp. MP71]
MGFDLPRPRVPMQVEVVPILPTAPRHVLHVRSIQRRLGRIWMHHCRNQVSDKPLQISVVSLFVLLKARFANKVLGQPHTSRDEKAADSHCIGPDSAPGGGSGARAASAGYARSRP